MKVKVKPLSCILMIITFLFVNNHQVFGQEKDAIYLTGELNTGNYWGLNLNLNYVFEERYSLQAGYSGLIRESKSEPDDFSSGLVGIFSFGLAEFHFDQMENYQILVGKIFRSNKSGTIRLNIAGGIGYTIIREPTNWIKKTDNFLGENYTYDIDKHATISLIINPKVEFPFTRYFGLTLSPMLQINKDRIFVGVGIGAMVGLLRKEQISPQQ